VSALEVATAAHDLRNRLGIAGCEVHLLRCRLGPNSTVVSEYLASLERSLDAANVQLEALLELTYSDVSLGSACKFSTLDLVQLAEQLLAEQRASGAPHDFTLTSTVHELVGVWDECRLRQALGSLLDNAITYSPASGEVAVAIDRQGRDAVLRVTDHGMGIRARDLPHVFEPFFRARNAEATAPGLGLGLATARLIVEQYGGSVRAHSVEGRGATFTIRLPIAQR
jgi:signal transduction histidine kinase